ncbi:MAG: RimJ/RimL family protein N-acetyltransferase [Candidatus Poriferisodalaceae bacterium]|jgi:RimJ/RimL family protein N-acetyltransferase
MPELVLRPTVPRDVRAVIAIEQHPEVGKWAGQWDSAGHMAAIAADNAKHLVMVDEIDEVIGYGILTDLFNVDDNVEFKRIALARWGEGIGQAFVEAMLAQAFSIPSVHRVWLDVVSTNFAAVAVYVQAGFQREGTMRQAYFDRSANDGRIDMYLMSILRPEWERSKVSAAPEN